MLSMYNCAFFLSIIYMYHIKVSAFVFVCNTEMCCILKMCINFDICMVCFLNILWETINLFGLPNNVLYLWYLGIEIILGGRTITSDITLGDVYDFTNGAVRQDGQCYVSNLRYFCLFAIVMSNTYCVVFLFCFFHLVYAMLPVSLDCTFLIASSVLSDVYLLQCFKKKL
jgi:hypothetical protein